MCLGKILLSYLQLRRWCVCCRRIGIDIEMKVGTNYGIDIVKSVTKYELGG